MSADLMIGVSALSHGVLHALIFAGLLYQGWLGFGIRSQRRTGRLQFDVVRRHRKFGPILICVAAIGYVSGLVLVYIDEGNLIEYPLHLFFGSLAVFLLLVQYTMSTAIRGTQSPWRAPHFYTGVGTLCVYGVQLVIGTGILF